MASLEIYLVCAALIVSTYTDIKTREVPDWLNFSLIAAGFVFAIIKSILSLNILPLYSTIIGFGLAFIISVIMFYSGQWGGGDAKMLMGVGALFGAGFSFADLFMSFLFNLIFAGGIYGVLWGIILGIINRRKIIIELRKMLSTREFIKIKKIVVLILSSLLILIIILPLGKLKLPLLILTLIMFSTFYLWVYIKIIEKVCMIKKVNPKVLTEGDWIVKDIVIDGTLVAGKKDLGVSKEQIDKLVGLYKKKKIKEVTIKTGIPFIPSFLISFILTMYFGNIFLHLI